jgi:UDP-N-acetylmuramyl tripeptide synthase
LLEKAGKKVGLIGTLGARWTRADGDKQYEDLKFTTPQASDLQELLANMVSRELSHVAMEVSSHAGPPRFPQNNGPLLEVEKALVQPVVGKHAGDQSGSNQFR